MNKIFLFLLICLAFVGCGPIEPIEPKKTYTVFDVTDSSGKTYRNLNRRRFNENLYVDYYSNEYTFHGNYTTITRRVSGDQFLKEVKTSEKE